MGTRRTPEDRAARRAADAHLLQRPAQRSDTAPDPGGPAVGWVAPRRRHCWVHLAAAPDAAAGAGRHVIAEGVVVGWRRRSDEHGEQRWFAWVVIAGPDHQPQVLELPSPAVRAADTSAS